MTFENPDSWCHIIGMEAARMDIGVLADAAGLSRRAIRFYVQRGLLPAPLGLGRGRHYDASHLERLREIQRLQGAGHSLDAIGRIVSGQAAGQEPPPTAAEAARRAGPTKPTLSSELWARLRIADGVELHFDATRHQPDVEQLLALRDAVRAVFRGATASPDDATRVSE
jgi:DNA-binding transcriptional MerR regulator